MPDSSTTPSLLALSRQVYEREMFGNLFIALTIKPQPMDHRTKLRCQPICPFTHDFAAALGNLRFPARLCRVTHAKQNPSAPRRFQCGFRSCRDRGRLTFSDGCHEVKGHLVCSRQVTSFNFQLGVQEQGRNEVN